MLSFDVRKDVFALLQAGLSQREIARRLGVSRSFVSKVARSGINFPKKSDGEFRHDSDEYRRCHQAGRKEAEKMKKKSSRKKPGHFCRDCGRRRANEKFSGKGHAAHICKECDQKQRTAVNLKKRIADSPRPMGNLFADLPKELPEELTETLAASEHVRVERIVSTGQSSPDDFWYDQEENEWVIVLRGSAALEFQGESQLRRLLVGDWVFIPAHQKHRVVSTSQHYPTVWLAAFFK